MQQITEKNEKCAKTNQNSFSGSSRCQKQTLREKCVRIKATIWFEQLCLKREVALAANIFVMSAAASAGTGAARASRERKSRATARHVLWLTSQYQAVQAHHTAPPGSSTTHVPIDVLAQLNRIEHNIGMIVAKVNTLEGLVGAMVERHAEPHLVRVQTQAPPEAEAATG